MGKQIILGAPTSEEVLPHGRREDFLKSLIGKRGVAKTMMLPAGAITIENRTVDAVSEGMVIDAGQAVQVIEAKGNRVVVRPIEDDQANSKSDDVDPLSKSFDSLGIEPFDE
jgi:membrane protein implicated in regulation of membrane protease activity